MNAVTYRGARASRGAISRRIKAEKARPLLTRFLDALKESRRQQARRVIVDHAQLLPNIPDSPVQVRCPRSLGQ
jgi:hypothetical protein